MQEKLLVTINDNNMYYTLYSDGVYAAKHNYIDAGITEITYKRGAVLFLYYTYPAYRVVYCVRNTLDAGADTLALPGLSARARILFMLERSRVDKTKRAVSFLNARYGGAYRWGDTFYRRLALLLREPGKINYGKVAGLALAEAGSAGGELLGDKRVRFRYRRLNPASIVLPVKI